LLYQLSYRTIYFLVRTASQACLPTGRDFQSFALPTELPHHLGTANIIKGMEKDKNTAKKVVLLFLFAPVMATFNP